MTSNCNHFLWLYTSYTIWYAFKLIIMVFELQSLITITKHIEHFSRSGTLTSISLLTEDKKYAEYFYLTETVKLTFFQGQIFNPWFELRKKTSEFIHHHGIIFDKQFLL